MHFSAVAPPRGERGLKLYAIPNGGKRASRSPSWGAWIEMYIIYVACVNVESLPLVGSVD